MSSPLRRRGSLARDPLVGVQPLLRRLGRLPARQLPRGPLPVPGALSGCLPGQLRPLSVPRRVLISARTTRHPLRDLPLGGRAPCPAAGLAGCSRAEAAPPTCAPPPAAWARRRPSPASLLAPRRGVPRCFSTAHPRSECRREIYCARCCFFGHKAKQCTARLSASSDSSSPPPLRRRVRSPVGALGAHSFASTRSTPDLPTPGSSGFAASTRSATGSPTPVSVGLATDVFRASSSPAAPVSSRPATSSRSVSPTGSAFSHAATS
nr:serine/arginine repetitive matrix protein 1-like [Aegilops tauschii subsp. strangulata]